MVEAGHRYVEEADITAHMANPHHLGITENGLVNKIFIILEEDIIRMDVVRVVEDVVEVKREDEVAEYEDEEDEVEEEDEEWEEDEEDINDQETVFVDHILRNMEQMCF